MPRGRPLEVARELLEAFVRNGRATEYLVNVLPSSIWRTPPPNGRGRTIAGIVAHHRGQITTLVRDFGHVLGLCDGSRRWFSAAAPRTFVKNHGRTVVRNRRLEPSARTFV